MYLDEVVFTITDKEGFVEIDHAIIPLILDIINVYFNLYILIPAFFRKRKYPMYSLLTLLGVVFTVVLTLYYVYKGSGETPYLEDYIASSIGTATLLATAIAIKIGKYSFEQKKLTDQLRLDQSKLELNYLKQQVNPHFLFNVLNTINVQSQSDPKSVSKTVLELSDMLRYQIYDAGNSETVPINKEIEFLKNYSSLEKIRRKNLSLGWKQKSNIPKTRITPFLFLPLVENAFKHSKSLTEQDTFVNISWDFEDSNLKFCVENSIGDVANKEGGFGIDNLKKRLEILYPESYDLELSIKDRTHIACLSIKINESNNN